MKAENLCDVLATWAHLTPKSTAYTYLSDIGEQDSVTYLELDRRARAIAAHLIQAGATGERALLLYGPGLDFLSGFWGCLYAGVIGIPAYLPRNDRTAAQIAAIQGDADARFALTNLPTESSLERWKSILFLNQEVEIILTDLIEPESAGPLPPAIGASDLAYLQYTSGSTSAPKGVMVSHNNVLVNMRIMEEAWGVHAAGCSVTWTPHFHDMGLVLGLLYPLWLGQPCYLMAPATFVQRPERWLEAITQYRGTATNAPNFAFELCVDTIDASRLDRLDLSSLKIVCNAAEPVRPQTLKKFVEKFAPAGFRAEAFFPSYGLAEATLAVTSYRAENTTFSIIDVSEAVLAQGRVEIAPGPLQNLEQADLNGVRSLTSCGATTGDTQVAIVNAMTRRRCATNEIGEVWVGGATITLGYWRRPEETASVFQAYITDTGEGPFLRTGDLGFLHNGELIIAGRLKDLIIIHGRNVYPQDIECTVQGAHEAVRPDAGAAFSLEVEGSEEFGIVQEIKRTYRKTDLAPVATAIRRAVWDEHQLSVHVVALVSPGTVPKTTSGKIQRNACRSALLSGNLTLLYRESQDVTGQPQTGLIAPRTDFERNLAGLWQNTLGRTAFGVTHSFFELGGTSLQLMRLLLEVELAFGVSLSPGDFRSEPTIERMSIAIVDAMVCAEAIKVY